MRQAKTILLLLVHVSVFFSTTLTAQYRFDSWTTESGLPQNSVNSIVQTRDGYIWFATFGGLVRFDGIKFKIFNTINAPIFGSNRLVSVLEAPDGRLLIGGQNGDLISYKDETFTPIIKNPVSQRTPLQLLGALKNGEIWLYGQSGLEKHLTDPSGQRISAHIDIPNEAQPTIGGVVEGNEGEVWVSTSTALYLFQNGAAQTFLYPPELPVSKTVNGQLAAQVVRLLRDRKGRFWLASTDFLARFENGKFTLIDRTADAYNVLAENIDGTFFLISQGKLYRLANDKKTEVLIDDPAVLSIYRSMLADREGNLWIGTNGQGLRRYKKQSARTLGKAEGLTDGPVNFVFEDRDQNVWVGGDQLYQYRDGRFAPISQTANVNSAFQSKDGTLWFETWKGVMSYKDGKLSDAITESGLPVESVFEDRQGTFYYILRDGLVTVHDGQRRQYSAPDGFHKSLFNTVQSIFEDQEGGVWFALTGGACRFKDGVFTNYSAPAQLSNDNVRDIYEDRDGAIWFGTYGGGLTRLKNGKFFAITTREGMNEDIVSRIIVDDKDNFWMLGNRGVSVISRSALNDVADGRIKTIACESYGVSDGMLNSEGNGSHHPAGWRMSDGKFWFPSIRGVIVIDPAQNDLPPPPVFIEDVFLAGQQINAKSQIDVAPEQGNLEIHYTGLYFTKPEQVKFKYKLEGFDQNWIEVGTRRTAYYTQLPPGTYRFLVTASTTNGVWNEQAAIRVVIVHSNPIWKKWWFILSVSVLMILAVIVFYRLRLRKADQVRRQQQEFSRLLIDSQERERKRIAGELHDGLGQTLLIIKNRAFLGTKARDLENANEQFKEISVSSGDALNQAREIAYYLRPSQLERFGLTSALEEMVKQATESSEIEFVSRIQSLDGVFSPENEINFYRVVQELINNILKHSNASTATITITRATGRVELLVEDNGKGLNSETLNRQNRAGFGLFGIEERLRILGGKLSIASEPNAGTKVSVAIDKAQ